MIWIVLFIAIIVFANLCLVLRHPEHILGLSEPKPRVPKFTKDARCIHCDKPVTNDDAEAFMNVPLDNGKNLPVTVRICEECVSNS